MFSKSLAILVLSMSQLAWSYSHHQITSCAAFVARVDAQMGYAYTRVFEIFVKVDKSILKDPIEAVGFHYTQNRPEATATWQDQPMPAFFNSSDYFRTNLVLNPDLHPDQFEIEGLFWIRTQEGATYWIKSLSGGNFKFHKNLHQEVLNQGPLVSGRVSMNTLSFPLEFLNPYQCAL